MISEGTIVALSTASGTGAIALIRLSGSKAISLTDQVFKTRSGEKLIFQKSHTVHLGQIRDGKSIIDEVLHRVGCKVIIKEHAKSNDYKHLDIINTYKEKVVKYHLLEGRNENY